MFVTKTKYLAMEMRAVVAEGGMRVALARERVAKCQTDEVVLKLNSLVRRINDLGGERFLLHAKLPSSHSQFSKDDIQRLIQLCHPDKHEGKKLANEMTAKLLAAKEVAR